MGAAVLNPILLPAFAFGSVFLLVLALRGMLDSRSGQLAQRLARFAAPPPPARGVARGNGSGSGLGRAQRRFSTFALLDGFLGRQSFAERLDQELAAAALPLRVGEYLFIRWGAALALAAVAATFTTMPLLALPAAAAGYLAPAFYVRYRRGARLSLFNEQLVDGLQLISGSLRAGYSFLQGIEAVARELPSPIKDDFTITLEDLRIGMPIEDAMGALAARVPTEDVDMFVTSMLVQRSSGGNLAEVLENIGHTIRERIRIRREVMTLTAQERMSSYVVGALPIGAFAFLSLSNPNYLGLLFAEPMGQVMLGGAALLEIIGFIIIRKVIDIGL